MSATGRATIVTAVESLRMGSGQWGKTHRRWIGRRLDPLLRLSEDSTLQAVLSILEGLIQLRSRGRTGVAVDWYNDTLSIDVGLAIEGLEGRHPILE